MKVAWKISSEFSAESPVQAAFSVPKRNFKRAHDRNYLKRRMRETYRFHKHQLYDPVNLNEEKLALMIVYIGKDILQFQELNIAMSKAITRLLKEIL